MCHLHSITIQSGGALFFTTQPQRVVAAVSSITVHDGAVLRLGEDTCVNARACTCVPNCGSC